MIEFNKMSDNDLHQRLKAELDGPQPERSTVEAILEEMERRNPSGPAATEPVKACQKFAAETRLPKKPLWKKAIAAVLVVALLGIIPCAIGAGSFFSSLCSCTAELFCFRETEKPKRSFRTDDPGLQALQDRVEQMGVSQAVVPTWLPEGYELINLDTLSSPNNLTVVADYACAERIIQIVIRVYNNETQGKYQKDDNVIEQWECNGVTTYYLSNNETYCAVWQKNNIECAISADSLGDLKLIVNSIY